MLRQSLALLTFLVMIAAPAAVQSLPPGGHETSHPALYAEYKRVSLIEQFNDVPGIEELAEAIAVGTYKTRADIPMTLDEAVAHIRATNELFPDADTQRTLEYLERITDSKEPYTSKIGEDERFALILQPLLEEFGEVEAMRIFKRLDPQAAMEIKRLLLQDPTKDPAVIEAIFSDETVDIAGAEGESARPDPPPGWHETSHPALYAEYKRVSLIKQFNDVPGIEQLAEAIAVGTYKTRADIPMTLDEAVAHIRATNELFPDADTQRTLEYLERITDSKEPYTSKIGEDERFALILQPLVEAFGEAEAIRIFKRLDPQGAMELKQLLLQDPTKDPAEIEAIFSDEVLEDPDE